MSRNNRDQGGPPRQQPPETRTPTAPSPPRTSDRTALYTLAGVIAASTVGFIGSQWVAKSAFDAEMVQIGVGILSADPSKSDVAPAREWAIKLVETHSGQDFSVQDRASLLHHPIQTSVPRIAGLPLSGIPCSALQRNSDGSWTVLHAESGNLVMNNIRLSGGMEAKLFDQFCGEGNGGQQ
jgi:hypothetical protein